MSQFEPADAGAGTTTVTVKCTGHVRAAVGKATFTYTFTGDDLRSFLDSFFADYDVAELLIAMEPEAESARGWTPELDERPGTWKQNPEGDRIRRYARVLINGRFNEHLEGFDTPLADGDRVSLMYPFVYCV